MFLRVVRAFARGPIGVGSILHGGPTHRAISRSTTGVTKAVVCVILSVGWCI